MNGAFKFEKVGKDGELKHGEISKQQFLQQIGTHGIMFCSSCSKISKAEHASATT
jgi:hypothetical protein